MQGPDFCPVGPSNKHFYKVILKFVETVLFALTSGTNMVKRVCRDCPIPHCGAKYLVKLSSHGCTSLGLYPAKKVVTRRETAT